MTGNRFIRRHNARLHPDPRFGGMLLISLGLHLAVALVFNFGLLPRHRIERRPVYVVDLVNLPVASPQAGRPDARPPSAQPPAAKAVRPEPTKIPEPAKQVAPAKKPEPTKTKPVEKAPDYETETLSAIEKLRRQREIEELKEKLAGLKKQDTRSAAGSQAPVGMPEGKGSEAGISYDAWLHQYLKEAWTLSKYQVARRDLEAKVKLVFDSQGNLRDYRFLRPSGDERFDDSVRRAVLQLKRLPTAPGRPMEPEIVFNLKELLE
jgi:TonB family protein